MSGAHCLSPQASGAAASRRRAGAEGAHHVGHHHPHPVVVVVAPLPPQRASSPRPVPGGDHQHHPYHHHHHHHQRAIILHPRHAYRLPRPLSVVVAPAAAATKSRAPSSSSSPPIDRALPLDALTSIAARLGDGKSLAAFAATCRACKQAAYDERLWQDECERRFGPVVPAPLPPPGGAPQPPCLFSWRKLYAFNAAAYESVVAATREAQRAAAMARVLGGAAARRLMAARVAFATATVR